MACFWRCTQLMLAQNMSAEDPVPAACGGTLPVQPPQKPVGSMDMADPAKAAACAGSWHPIRPPLGRPAQCSAHLCSGATLPADMTLLRCIVWAAILMALHTLEWAAQRAARWKALGSALLSQKIRPGVFTAAGDSRATSSTSICSFRGR